MTSLGQGRVLTFLLAFVGSIRPFHQCHERGECDLSNWHGPALFLGSWDVMVTILVGMKKWMDGWKRRQDVGVVTGERRKEWRVGLLGQGFVLN